MNTGIEFYKEYWNEMILHLGLNKEDIRAGIETLRKKSEFLKLIYSSSAKFNFSTEFKNCAYREYQKICKESSALHSILREDL